MIITICWPWSKDFCWSDHRDDHARKSLLLTDREMLCPYTTSVSASFNCHWHQNHHHRDHHRGFCLHHHHSLCWMEKNIWVVFIQSQQLCVIHSSGTIVDSIWSCFSQCHQPLLSSSRSKLLWIIKMCPRKWRWCRWWLFPCSNWFFNKLNEYPMSIQFVVFA